MNLNKYGILGTTLFHAIIAFILIFFGFSYPDPPPEEEGILVNFGTDESAYGYTEPAGDEFQGGEAEEVPAEESTEENIPEQTATETTPVEELTENLQDYEESPVKENKPTREELRQQELERQRQEELRRQREEEERKREQAERLQQLGESAFGNKGVGTQEGSEGIGEGEGNQGSLSGTPGADNYGDGGGLGDGISYGLGDRNVRGNLPKPLLSGCDVSSRIVIRVQIDVDSEGNVVGNPRIMESTYQDDCIYEAVIGAARRAKFSTAPDKYRQRGWIRYIIEP